MIPRWLLLASLGVTVGACATPRSSLLDTAGFYVEYTIAVEEGAEPVALADFRDRGEHGGALELVGGDVATVDDAVMRAKDGTPQPPVDVSYGYFAPVSTAPTHRFALLRDGDPKIEHVVVELPFPSATIQGGKRATVKYPGPALLSWAKVPGTRIKISVKPLYGAHCRSLTLEPQPEDPGAYTIDTKSLRAQDSSAACTFAIRVIRSKQWPIGAPYIGGVLRSMSTSTVELDLQ